VVRTTSLPELSTVSDIDRIKVRDDDGNADRLVEGALSNERVVEEGVTVGLGGEDKGMRCRSVGRLAGAEPVFSVATSSSRLYVGTRSLKVYDFAQSVPVPLKSSVKMPVLDKIRNMFMSSDKVL